MIAQSKKYMFEPFIKSSKWFNSSIIKPPTIPKKSPKYCCGRSLFLKISATSKKVITGESVVMITPPEPAKPYFTPKNEKIINAMLSIELPAIYLRFERLIQMGSFTKNKIGKNESAIIKKRQKMITSIGISMVSILSALQPPPHKSIARMMR